MEEYWDKQTDEALTDDDLHARYDEALDELDGGELAETYGYARILKEVDPIAYSVGFNDWLDGELGESITDEEPDDDDEEEDA